jgi:glycosyltransferase involved in cell wall biosynthesis
VLAKPRPWGAAGTMRPLQGPSSYHHLKWWSPLIGFMQKNEIVQLYQNAFIFTCLSVYEGFGLIVAEALACCVPMIVSDIPPFREILQDAGIRIDPYNTDAFASWVEVLLLDTILYQEMKAHLRKRRSLFTIAKMACNTKRIYSQIY